MTEVLLIKPPKSEDHPINSQASLVAEWNFCRNSDGKIASKNDIDIAKDLGFDISSVYSCVQNVMLDLKISDYNHFRFNSIQQFTSFIELFDILTGKSNKPSNGLLKDIEWFNKSFSISITVTKHLLMNPITIKFPNESESVITESLFKSPIIQSIVPEEYCRKVVKLCRLVGYIVKFYESNNTIKVGCNCINVSDLYQYFEEILRQWEKKNALTSTINVKEE